LASQSPHARRHVLAAHTGETTHDHLLGAKTHVVEHITSSRETVGHWHYLLVEATRSAAQARHFPLRRGDHVWVGVRQLHAILDAGLRHIAGLVEAQLGHLGYGAVPGAGAAGGFGFGAMSFLGARLKSGIDMVLDLTGFDQAAARADIIITGEGRLDGQSARGKLIQGICARAGATPVIALCGDLAIGEDEVHALGLSRAVNINPVKRPLAQMLAATAQNLEIAAAALLPAASAC